MDVMRGVIGEASRRAAFHGLDVNVQIPPIAARREGGADFQPGVPGQRKQPQRARGSGNAS
jgi:hypothetical protein